MVKIIRSGGTDSEWSLSFDQTKHFNRLREQSLRKETPMVLWGWKRDKVIDNIRYPESRTVYFSADLALDSEHRLTIDRSFFFLE